MVWAVQMAWIPWWATGIMSLVALTLVAFFWRKRYLARTAR